MRLTVLGCAGTFPGPDGPCSGYLIEHDGYRLVVDLGSGALGQLQRHAGLLDIDAIYVSHLHADHCIDLVAYSYARRYHPGGIPPPLPVYGPAGTAARIFGSYEVPPSHGLQDVFAFHEVPPETRQLGPLTVSAVRVNHPVECHGLRIDAGGRSLVYSGDTGECDDLIALAQGCDLFLCEASWSEADESTPNIHLSGRQAGRHAARADVGRLLLTHVVPWADAEQILDEATVAFGGSTDLARCGASYDV